jgi:hypothetical protein
MTARTINERRRRALWIGGIARRVMRAATAVDFVAAASMAVSVHHALAAFFLFACVCFVAFDLLGLGPMLRSAREAIERDEQRDARLAELYRRDA